MMPSEDKQINIGLITMNQYSEHESDLKKVSLWVKIGVMNGPIFYIFNIFICAPELG